MNRSTFCVVFVFLFLISFGTNAQDLPKTVRFGVCADVHKDIMHDADERLQIFVDHMNEEKVDFIIHLGDFCRPYDYNNSFMKVWLSFDGPGYHVLGNHDMDGGFTREQTMTYWSMPARYYSFDKDGYHFIVLDGNDPSDPPLSGYPRFIGEQQQKWLRADLAATELEVIVFSHQSFEDKVDGVVNKEDIRKILESAKHENGEQKVIACFSGHHHTNYYRRINGIYYIQINSMSDWWMGSNYANLRYSEEIDQKYPYIRYTAPYKVPLYALVSLDSAGVIKINGVESEWVGPSPWELNYPYLHKYDEIVPRITDRMLYYSQDKIELTPAEQPKSDFRYVNITPHGALFENRQAVTLTANENDVIIRYTLDGSDPVSSSALYSSNLLLDNSTTLKTTAFRNGKAWLFVDEIITN